MKFKRGDKVIHKDGGTVYTVRNHVGANLEMEEYLGVWDASLFYKVYKVCKHCHGTGKAK